MSQESVSGFPEQGDDLRGSLGNFSGSSGNSLESLRNFRRTSGLLLSSTVRELQGKSPKNFRGSSGELPGKPGDFPEARGSLTPSLRLANLSPITVTDSGSLTAAKTKTQNNSRRLELSTSKKQNRTKSRDKVRAVSTQGSRQVCLSRCPKS